MNAVFDQAQINRDRAAMLPSSATTALPELLRCSLACLLFSTAFAGFVEPTRGTKDIHPCSTDPV